MGNGVPDQGSDKDFCPTTGDLVFTRYHKQEFVLTRTQHNDIRAACIAAGGMSNVTAAYTAIRGAHDTIEAGRDAWLDRMTQGADSTETGLLRRGEVWYWSTEPEYASPPQP